MPTSQHSFIDIFNSDFVIGEDGTNITLRKIVIPKIQRDYAQGREDAKTARVRERFLDSLYDALTKTPITLDFIYGDIDKDGMLTPLDGQQRLTTLYLLHWYAAKKENIDETKCSFLANFTYETRYTARDFCQSIVSFMPTFKANISEEIINQSWFPYEWKKDPTVKSMLVMLDAINEKFSVVTGIWEKLEANAITFHFLPIKDMGLTDELYIKMNSRGKPLTQFEHFKAEFERKLKEYDENVAKRIMQKLDVAWTDTLWTFRDQNCSVDDEFLAYFRFITDILYYKDNKSPQGKSKDEFDLLKEHFDKSNPSINQNIEILETYFDCWAEMKDKTNIDNFFSKFISHDVEKGKTRVANRDAINSFEDCIKDFGIVEGSKVNRNFKRTLMLYSAIQYRLNLTTISEDQFARRIRIVNNLISNSTDEISDAEDRVGGNRLPAILKQIDSIITTGIILDKQQLTDINFNINQLEEEKAKLDWEVNNQSSVENLFRLEGHELLYGQISIVGLENVDKVESFETLFNCDLDKVNKTLRVLGDYGQRENRTHLIQYGSCNSKSRYSWDNLFHKTTNNLGFDKTKAILNALLYRYSSFDNAKLDQIINSYIAECENNQSFPPAYYFVKYDSFRPASFGKYKVWDENEPYKMLVLQSKSKASERAYQPYLGEVDETHLDKDNYGKWLKFDYSKVRVTVENDRYAVLNLSDDIEIDSLKINQNEQGIDTVDRIIEFRNFLKNKAYQ